MKVETLLEVLTLKIEKRQLTCYIFQGLNFRLAFAIAAGAFGSAFQHGYNTGVVNAPQDLIMKWIQNCPEEGLVEASNVAASDKNDYDTDVSDVDACEMSDERVTLIWAMIVSSFCVGGIIGGSVVGVVATRLGR